MEILPSCGYVSTTVWLHHLDNGMHREKDKWELCKNTTGCFEQILEVATHEIAAVLPLAFFLSKPSK